MAVPKKASAPGVKQVEEAVVNLSYVQIEEMSVRVVGASPLVVHRMGSKALQQMAAAQGLPGFVKQGKQPKNPVECFLDTLYRPLASDKIIAVDEKGKELSTYADPEMFEGLWPVWAWFASDRKFDRFCFPAHAFREAMGSASYASGSTKDIVTIRRMISMSRVMLPIETKSPPQMRFDVADVQGKADLRFRAQFDEWAMSLVFRYATCVASKDTVLNLLRLGGILSGIGEMRPEKKVGTFGLFDIDPKSIKVTRLSA